MPSSARGPPGSAPDDSPSAPPSSRAGPRGGRGRGLAVGFLGLRHPAGRIGDPDQPQTRGQHEESQPANWPRRPRSSRAASASPKRTIVGPGVASNVVAFGKLKSISVTTKAPTTSPRFAKVMLHASAPGVQRHATWSWHCTPCTGESRWSASVALRSRERGAVGSSSPLPDGG